jgi:hypothetical protein
MPLALRPTLRTVLLPAVHSTFHSYLPPPQSRSFSSIVSLLTRPPRFSSPPTCTIKAYQISAFKCRSFHSASTDTASSIASAPPPLTGLAVDIAALTDSLTALGLPLTCAIAAVAIAFRSALLPLVFDQVRASNRFASFIMPVLSQRFSAIGALPRDQRGSAYDLYVQCFCDIM